MQKAAERIFLLVLPKDSIKSYLCHIRAGTSLLNIEVDKILNIKIPDF